MTVVVVVGRLRGCFWDGENKVWRGSLTVWLTGQLASEYVHTHTHVCTDEMRYDGDMTAWDGTESEVNKERKMGNPSTDNGYRDRT